MNNLENHEFIFEEVDESIKQPKKTRSNKKTGIVVSKDQDYELVIPEVLEFEEIDECLVFSNRKKSKLYFDSTNTQYVNTGYPTENNQIRFYNTEADWDLLRSLVVMKCMRRNRKKEKIVLDDFTEFRLLPKEWAEELCNYLFRNDFVFVVYENNTR